jgi:hypothetical protein
MRLSPILITNRHLRVRKCETTPSNNVAALIWRTIVWICQVLWILMRIHIIKQRKEIPKEVEGRQHQLLFIRWRILRWKLPLIRRRNSISTTIQEWTPMIPPQKIWASFWELRIFQVWLTKTKTWMWKVFPLAMSGDLKVLDPLLLALTANKSKVVENNKLGWYRSTSAVNPSTTKCYPVESNQVWPWAS